MRIDFWKGVVAVFAVAVLLAASAVATPPLLVGASGSDSSSTITLNAEQFEEMVKELKPPTQPSACPQTITSVGALFVAVVALALSFWAVKNARELFRCQVMPLLTMRTVAHLNHLEACLVNSGAGVAQVVSLDFLICDEEKSKSDWKRSRNLAELIGLPRHQWGLCPLYGPCDMYLKVGEEWPLFRAESGELVAGKWDHNGALEVIADCRRKLDNVYFVVHYKDLLGVEMEPYERKLIRGPIEDSSWGGLEEL